MLLTDQELSNISRWQYRVRDGSILSRFLTPLLSNLANYLPSFVSPNLITLTGLSIISTLYLLTEFQYYQPNILSLLVCYYLVTICDYLDGILARKTRNDTPFGELLDHSVDIVALFVITRITLKGVIGYQSEMIPVYLVIGIIFCYTHYIAFLTDTVFICRYTGPTEYLFYLTLFYLSSYWIEWKHFLPEKVIETVASLLLVVTIIGYYFFIARLFPYGIDEDSYYRYRVIRNIKTSRNVFYLLIFILVIIAIKYILPISYLSIVSIYVIINTEMIIAKMAESSFRTDIMFLCYLCIFSKTLAIAIAFGFVVVMLSQIKGYMNLPLLGTFGKRKKVV